MHYFITYYKIIITFPVFYHKKLKLYNNYKLNNIGLFHTQKYNMFELFSLAGHFLTAIRAGKLRDWDVIMGDKRITLNYKHWYGVSVEGVEGATIDTMFCIIVRERVAKFIFDKCTDVNQVIDEIDLIKLFHAIVHNHIARAEIDEDIFSSPQWMSKKL